MEESVRHIVGMFQDVPVASWYIQLEGGHSKPTGLQSVPAEDSTEPLPYFVLWVLNVVSKYWQNHLGRAGRNHNTWISLQKDMPSYFTFMTTTQSCINSGRL